MFYGGGKAGFVPNNLKSGSGMAMFLCIPQNLSVSRYGVVSKLDDWLKHPESSTATCRDIWSIFEAKE